MKHLKNSETGLQPTDLPSTEELRPLETSPPKGYVQPTVISHSGEDILDELGPAQACYPFSSCGVTP